MSVHGDDALISLLEYQGRHLFGKYPGVVTDNQDPEKRGRLKVQLPSLLDVVENWAVPCVPFAGPDMGFYMMPEIGTMVWVEFEAGHPDYPIYSGFQWARGQFAQTPTDPWIRSIRTKRFALQIDDQKGEVQMQFDGKPVLTITSIALSAEAPSVLIKGNGNSIEVDSVSVRVNKSALEVL